MYYRVSTKDKQTFDSQKREVEEWLAEHSISDYLTFTDQKSGKSEDRQGYQEILRLALAKEINTVVCYKIDRFGRDAISLIHRFSELVRANVDFVAIKTPGLNSLNSNDAHRVMMLGIFATLAEMERKSISDRTKAGLAVARSKGRVGGRPTKLTEKNRLKVVKLRERKHTIQEICTKTKLSKLIVRKLLGTVGAGTAARV